MGHPGFDPDRPTPRDELGQFLEELSACIRSWEMALAGPALGQTGALAELVGRSRNLVGRTPSSCRGVALRLQAVCDGAQRGTELGQLRADLAVVKELEAQVRHEFVAATAPRPTASPAPPFDGGSPGSVEPPRFITHFGARVPGVVAPPGPSISPASVQFPPRLDESRAENRMPAGVPLPPLAAPVPPLAPLAPPAELPALPPQGFAPVPVIRQLSPRPSPPPAPPPSVRGGAHAVKSRFGFKPLTAPPAPPSPAQQVHSPVGAPPPMVSGVPPMASAPPARGSAPPPGGPGLHGLAPPRALSVDARHPSRPQDLGNVPGLPDLPNLPAFEPSAMPTHLRRGERSERPERSDRGARRSESRPPPEPASPRGRHREGGDGKTMAYLFALGGFGLAAFIVLVVGVAVYVSRHDGAASAGSVSAAVSGIAPAVPGSTPAAETSAAPLPRSRLLTEDERFRSLLATVHGRGKESGALRVLLDEQASLVATAMSPQACVGPQCAALRQVNQLVTGKESRKLARRHAHAPDALRSRWLSGYDMPEIPVEDDPRVQARFEYYTENAVGREQFQQMLFRCGAFRDSIQTLLVRRGMPTSLLAVVFAESSCVPTAKSQVGAEGLWQFIPEAARAYGLRIIPNIVDERHSPGKSTDSAVRYLSDLYAKLGAWDLVFAAYNMGPFGLLTRLAKIEGDNVGFWDLADAEILPDETVFYVPNIEAIALILANLQRLKFTGQTRAPEITAELNVPPNTRLGLVARAAAMSLNDLRRMNLDIMADSTPNVPSFVVEVPKDNVWQARDTLAELIKTRDDADLCVPGTFDWGRQRFTPELAQACRARLAAAAAAPAPTPGAARAGTP